MKKQLLTAALITAAGPAFTQLAPQHITLKADHHCAFSQVLRQAGVSYLALNKTYRSAAERVPGASGKGSSVVYDIPVVFHVIYGASTPAFNLPDSIIVNQVAVLNGAFRKMHADTGNVRPYFKPLSGDAEIQFHLATVDPQGNPTSGITRTLSSRNNFGSANDDLDSLERVKHTATGGYDAWNPARYLNIWVANLSNAQGSLSTLGYGLPPLNPLPANWPAGSAADLAGLGDGVVLQTHMVGSNNPLSTALQGLYTKGRGGVHEVGHYLGLQHVFGDNDGVTPDCGAAADDGIGDTPTQSTPSFDQNSGVSCPPSTKNSCGAGTSGDLPDMWEDYMDYARDACQVMFTQDQITLMRSVLAQQRLTLTDPNATAVSAVPQPASFRVFPNPSSRSISVSVTGAVTSVTILNLLGQCVLRIEGPAAGLKRYDISPLPGGQYIIIVNCGGRQETGHFAVSR